MVARRLALVLTTLLFLVAAKQRAVQHPAGWPLTEPPRDVFTSSNTSEVVTRHLALDLTVDFAQQRLRGTATLELENLTGTHSLVLDTENLDVSSVKLDGDTNAVWSFGTANSFGRPLNITITPSTRFVTITYSSSPAASGLNWNTAEQSYGRKQPYLYSLNEPIGARSWIPIQDTPAMRLTYEAVLHVPHGLLGLMSAIDNAAEANDTGVYRFNMPYTIPPYLVALAVGRLQFHEFDERTGVYAEPELMEDAAWELQYLPEMVNAAERIAGRFPFQRHDVLLMPPTFTAGGMEHPMLNFIAPFGLISGNHPAVPQPSTLIAHELAHAWAGDATTLATWNDVWLNEGITSYLTLRIIEEMSGVQRAELAWFNDRRTYASYANNVQDPTVTRLHRDVPFPFAGFSFTGYTKGELFMKTLEDTIGRPAFDAFLRRYFQLFAFRWADDQTFLAALHALVLDGDPALEPKLRLDEWLYEPGLPSNVTAATSSVIFSRVQQRVAQFSSGTPLAQLSPSTWLPGELEMFLSGVSSTAVQSHMAELDATFGLSALNSPPLDWLRHSIYNHYEPGLAGVERALLRGGGNNTIVTIYGWLSEVPSLHSRALTIFAQARKRYHPDVEAQVASILGLSSAKSNKSRNGKAA
jgi:aminopeptidase N